MHFFSFLSQVFLLKKKEINSFTLYYKFFNINLLLLTQRKIILSPSSDTQ